MQLWPNPPQVLRVDYRYQLVGIERQLSRKQTLAELNQEAISGHDRTIAFSFTTAVIKSSVNIL